MSHTKGPWAVKICDWGYVVNASDCRIVTVYFDKKCIHETIDRQKADAKLIATAPELDELLADVMAEYQVAASVTHNTEYAKRYIELAQRYDALMAKAKS